MPKGSSFPSGPTRHSPAKNRRRKVEKSFSKSHLRARECSRSRIIHSLLDLYMDPRAIDIHLILESASRIGVLQISRMPRTLARGFYQQKQPELFSAFGKTAGGSVTCQILRRASLQNARRAGNTHEKRPNNENTSENRQTCDSRAAVRNKDAQTPPSRFRFCGTRFTPNTTYSSLVL